MGLPVIGGVQKKSLQEAKKKKPTKSTDLGELTPRLRPFFSSKKKYIPFRLDY